jgi:hypothetical protein
MHQLPAAITSCPCGHQLTRFGTTLHAAVASYLHARHTYTALKLRPLPRPSFGTSAAPSAPHHLLPQACTHTIWCWCHTVSCSCHPWVRPAAPCALPHFSWWRRGQGVGRQLQRSTLGEVQYGHPGATGVWRVCDCKPLPAAAAPLGSSNNSSSGIGLFTVVQGLLQRLHVLRIPCRQQLPQQVVCTCVQF